jgi:TRAP-type mannitol/chloroaromatic compound transport system substrate-binding protein
MSDPQVTESGRVLPAIVVGLVALVMVLFGLYVTEVAKSPLSDRRVNTSTNDGAQPSDQTVYQWSMVTTWPKNFPGLGTAANEFAQSINEMSGGRLKIKVYGAGELVPALGVFDAVSGGVAQMGHGASYYWKGKIPASVFFTSVPFGMNAQEMNAWITEGGGWQLWRELYEPFGLLPFPAGNTGVQMAGWYNREINSIDDIKGLKMRIPGLGGEVWNRAGGVAVTIPGGELYTSLQTGVIDATEWVGPYNDLAMGFYQVAQYYYYPGWHEPGPTLELIVNQQAYESLPEDLQKMVYRAAIVANQLTLDQYTSRNNAALKELVENHGVKLRELPKDVLIALRKSAFEVYDELASQDPEFDRIYRAYNRFRVEAEDYHKISEQSWYKAREYFRDPQPVNLRRER